MLLLNLGARVAAAILQVPSDVIGSRLPMVAPFPTSLKAVKLRSKVDEFMKEWEVHIDSNHEDYMFQDGSATYGEVTTLGGRQLFHYMGLYDEDEATSFYDLGSGMGKLVIQAHMELSAIRETVGIELDECRHEIAMKRLAKAILPNVPHNIQLSCGDLHELNVSSATHIYVSSLCFTDEMMERLEEKLYSEASSMKCVATLKPFPSGGDGIGAVVEYVEMSWTKPFGCPVYFYTKL